MAYLVSGIESSELTPLHYSVDRVFRYLENRSKSARVRAICDCAWTQRTSLTAPFNGIKRKLSARDLASSICRTVGMESFRREEKSSLPRAKRRLKSAFQTSSLYIKSIQQK